MFLGKYSYNIDTKGRITIPSRFKEELGEKFVIIKWLDGCLAIYTAEQFALLYQQLQSLPNTMKESRMYVRTMMSSAMECELDKQNRVLLSPSLIKDAKIEKTVIFVGVGDHIELWSEESWNSFSEQSDSMFETVAEKLTEFIR